MKYYSFELVLFLNSKSYNIFTILEKVKKQCNYAYILHDKDTNKKSHFHILCFFKTQHSISAIKKLFDIDDQSIQVIKNKVGAIQYLIHKNDLDKYQYDINDIATNFDISKYFDNRVDSENQVIYDLITYVKSSNSYIYLKEFYDYILANNYWPYYRRNAYMINELIKEHNLLLTS